MWNLSDAPVQRPGRKRGGTTPDRKDDKKRKRISKALMMRSDGNAEYFITGMFFQMSENNISPILTSFEDVKVNHRRSDADVVGASCRCGAVIRDGKYPLIGCWN